MMIFVCPGEGNDRGGGWSRCGDGQRLYGWILWAGLLLSESWSFHLSLSVIIIPNHTFTRLREGYNWPLLKKQNKKKSSSHCNLPEYHLPPDIESNHVGFSELCNQSTLWEAQIWFIDIDVVAGVAWIVMYFISFEMAFIDWTTQHCSSCPALNNNIGDLTYFFPVPHLMYDSCYMH